VGPFLIFPIIIATAIAIMLSYYNMIPVFKSNGSIMALIGFVLIVLGIIFWLLAVLNSKIDNNIKSNKLVTTGIYGFVRHPIYAAFLYAVTGLTFISNNLYLLILPVIYWLILTVVMIKTEEKWLYDKFSESYAEYSTNVSRFVQFLRI
jgi:protein-S-isoprenylcysteine O-methyltransferase Ste14